MASSKNIMRHSLRFAWFECVDKDKEPPWAMYLTQAVDKAQREKRLKELGDKFTSIVAGNWMPARTRQHAKFSNKIPEWLATEVLAEQMERALEWWADRVMEAQAGAGEYIINTAIGAMLERAPVRLGTEGANTQQRPISARAGARKGAGGRGRGSGGRGRGGRGVR